MKSKKRLLLITVLALFFSLVLGGCGGKQEIKQGDNVVIAQVNGEDILYNEFYDIYNYTLISKEIDPETEDEEELAYMKEIKEQILEDLITRKVMQQKMEADGYEITDEIMKEAEDSFNSMIEMIGLQMQLQAQFGGDEGAEEKDYKKEAEEYVAGELELMNMTKEDYIKNMAEEIMANNYFEDLTKVVEASEEEIKSFYDKELEISKTDGNGAIDLIKPAQTRVKHILIKIADEDTGEYFNLYTGGKFDEAESFLEEKLAEIKPKAEEVLEKAKNGEDFEALIDEYGEDPGMESEEYKDGYLVDEMSNFELPFKETSLKLEEGEISDLVPTVYGYHIIKAYEKSEEKVYTLEEKRDEIKERLDREKKNEFVEKEIDRWMEEAEIVKYMDRI
ncbi:peptidylprolyl isomerase [Acetivibrio saccincola]|jgi:parvulin-like peptidyl-prolyl isomerase|nr:peptidylprolyl isomerase [Acetivibrio saccincola]NLW26080.1 peptidylprolyl isomerase [Acetivibrio saccincola]HOA96161.1 peptidylprolyl isomerase [Acetivibrio saccincola]HQD28294.1 peptidylprolyl isomerase [Acetivibrio saccincola]